MLEIRILGQLDVRRHDGSQVDPRAWRTGKTTDLLRLLALDAGSPVRVSSLTAKLWPEVSEAKARASLRNAASQIRKAVGVDCITRHLDALVLTDAWVDVLAYRSLVAEVGRAVRTHQTARAVSLAWQAEDLFRGDFEAYDDHSMWATQVRDSLTLIRRSALAAGAECALESGWFRDALELAERIIEMDPCYERAYRTLMSAHAALGETDLALRSFDSCRSSLAEELGADPSGETVALHLRILRGEDTASTPSTQHFVGHSDAVHSVCAAIRAMVFFESGPGLVCVAGLPGAGRTSFVREVSERIAAGGAVVSPVADLTRLGDASAVHRPTLLVLPLLEELDEDGADSLAQQLTGLPDGSPVCLLVPCSSAAQNVLLSASAGNGIATHAEEVRGLRETEVRVLAEETLHGPVGPHLLNMLQRSTGGLAGRAVNVLQAWESEGRLTMVSRNLELVARAERRPSPA